MATYDYVIVGGGTAACVLACRLGEHGKSVCVLEAGPADNSIWTRIPAGFTRLLRNPRFSWQFEFAGSDGTNGRTTHLVQGRTLGGSSAINGAVYSRGQAADFDLWEAAGNPGWSYQDVLPFFKKSERFIGEADDRYRGREGPIPVTVTDWRDPLCEAFLDGAGQVGIMRNADYNGQDQEGIGYCQSVIEGGRRWSAAHAYLHPARKAYGTHILTNTVVSRILIKHNRATGVLCHRRDSGEPVQIDARAEVLVCAGTIGSPKLLQLSGIGSPALLNRYGIEVVNPLHGVGENLHDHYCPRLVARARRDVDSINVRVRGLPLAKEILAWLRKQPSILSISPILLYGFGKTQPDLRSPDFALSFMPANYAQGVIGHIDDKPGMTCGAWQLRPQSRGYVRITSGDASKTPVIQPKFLDHEVDKYTVVQALKCARSVFASEPMQRFVNMELLPGNDVQTDDEILDYARQYGSTGYHVVGTCAMGPRSNQSAVVDNRLRVHGLHGLRVVDASVMPAITSANTCAATLMIAEKAADMILNEETGI